MIRIEFDVVADTAEEAAAVVALLGGMRIPTVVRPSAADAQRRLRVVPDVCTGAEDAS